MNIYTDGAQSSKTNKGGWAAVIENAVPIILTNSEENTTNNRMELTAVAKALEYIKLNPTTDKEINIYTDSAYISNCFKDKWYIKWQQNGWISSNKQPVKNQDLWKTIFSLLEDAALINYNINILKVKAHSNNYYNNLADQYAVMSRQGD